MVAPKRSFYGLEDGCVGGLLKPLCPTVAKKLILSKVLRLRRVFPLEIARTWEYDAN